LAFFVDARGRKDANAQEKEDVDRPAALAALRVASPVSSQRVSVGRGSLAQPTFIARTRERRKARNAPRRPLLLLLSDREVKVLVVVVRRVREVEVDELGGVGRSWRGGEGREERTEGEGDDGTGQRTVEFVW
jgi:hypothetical protein